MSIFVVLQALTAIVVASLGGFVIFKKPSREVSWHFGIFILGTAFWAFSLFMATSKIGQPTLWGRLAISFGSFMPAGFYLFLCSFPRRSRWFHIERGFVVVCALFFFIVSLSPLVVAQAWIIDDYITGTLGSWYLPFWFYYLGFLCASFIKCTIRSIRTTEPRERLQIRYITLGFALFFVPLLCTQFILPLFGIFKYNSLGPLFSLPLVAIIAYSIIRHQLMDIRVIIQRSLIYAVLLALTAVLYLVSVYLIGFLFNSATGTNIFWGGAVTTLFGIFSVPFLERFFRKSTDPIFFKERYDYPKAMFDLTKVLHTSLRQADIVERSSLVLKSLFRTRQVIFQFPSKEGKCPETVAPETVQSVPIIFENRCVGILELGEKQSGEPYNHEDKQLLETFAYQAAVALEKARLYEKVAVYSEGLEQLVEKRTQELRKLQEDQQQTMIDISHNLQTPLAIIRGELELLPELTADQEKIRVVKKSLDRVSQFIRQLLHLAKLDSAAFEIKKLPVNLAALVQEQAEYFEVMAEEKGIKISTIVAPNARVFGDQRLLQELLTNLVSNAIRYRAKNVESRILISVAETAQEVVLMVHDNGVGIAPEVLPELFTRYAAASRAGATEESTGLGLAICKRIAERHGATIAVSSKVGEGTEVTVTFPKFNS